MLFSLSGGKLFGWSVGGQPLLGNDIESRSRRQGGVERASSGCRRWIDGNVIVAVVLHPARLAAAVLQLEPILLSILTRVLVYPLALLAGFLSLLVYIPSAQLSNYHIEPNRPRTFTPLLEDRVFVLGKTLKDDLSPAQIDFAMVGEVAAHAPKLGLPDLQQGVDGTFSNFQTWQVGQKVISDKENHEDPIVDGELEIERERLAGHNQFDREIFS